VGLNRLDDEDYPAVTMGQAAELLEVQPAFLRSLDVGNVVSPARSAGGHRRYSRRQLELAARLRAMFDQGLTLDAAQRITRLEDELAAAHTRITELEQELGTAHSQPTQPGPP
jgi:MerR family transcriptional regulator, heat shock protein HspR